MWKIEKVWQRLQRELGAQALTSFCDAIHLPDMDDGVQNGLPSSEAVLADEPLFLTSMATLFAQLDFRPSFGNMEQLQQALCASEVVWREYSPEHWAWHASRPALMTQILHTVREAIVDLAISQFYRDNDRRQLWAQEQLLREDVVDWDLALQWHEDAKTHDPTSVQKRHASRRLRLLLMQWRRMIHNRPSSHDRHLLPLARHVAFLQRQRAWRSINHNDEVAHRHAIDQWMEDGDWSHLNHLGLRADSASTLNSRSWQPVSRCKRIAWLCQIVKCSHCNAMPSDSRHDTLPHAEAWLVEAVRVLANVEIQAYRQVKARLDKQYSSFEVYCARRIEDRTKRTLGMV